MANPVETRHAVRAWRLAALPLGMAGRSLAAAVAVRRGADEQVVRARTRRANAEALRDTLGRLKGGAMKAGQLLSTVDSLFPPDPDATWTAALTSLQEGVDAVPFDDVDAVLTAELGPAWRDLLVDLDPRPVAAASLGQVHRARLGRRDVAVKVQYPGVAAAVEADLRTLTWSLRAGALVASGLVVPPVVHELRTRVADELDYRREGRHQAAFAAAFRDDAEVVVPEVRLATGRVLVTDWCEAVPLVEVAAGGTRAERDRAGTRYQRFLLSAPLRARLLHADPHPGNFRVLPDGRLGVLDFGAVLPTPDGMPASFGRLMRVMTAADPATIDAGLRAEGFIRPGATVDAARLAAFLRPFSEPARHERFHYTPEWLRAMFTRGPDDPRDPDYAVAMRLTIPAEQLLTHRVWLGCVGVLCRLGATVPVRPELERWLPGFAG